jgi:hypothetical protein
MSKKDVKSAAPSLIEMEMMALDEKFDSLVVPKKIQPVIIFPFEEKDITSALARGIFRREFLNDIISWLQYYGYNNDIILKILKIGYLTPEVKSHSNDPKNIFFDSTRLENIALLIMSDELVKKCREQSIFKMLATVNFKCLLQLLGIKCEKLPEKLAHIFNNPFLLINLNFRRVLVIEEIFNLPKNIYNFLMQNKIFLNALANDKIDCGRIKKIPLVFKERNISACNPSAFI